MDQPQTASRLAAAVRAARQRRRWTREQLATESGLSFAAITQIETGRRTEVRVSSLVALAEALDVSIDYLVRGQVTTPMLQHWAYVYESPQHLADVAERTVRDGLEAGHTMLVVTAKPRPAAFRKTVRTNGQNIEFEKASDWYTTPAETTARFGEFVRDAIDGGAEWVDILTEPPPGWAGTTREETRAWMTSESLINLTLAPWPVSIGCLYDATIATRQVRYDLERTHPEIVTTDGRHASASYEPPEQFVTR